MSTVAVLLFLVGGGAAMALALAGVQPPLLAWVVIGAAVTAGTALRPVAGRLAGGGPAGGGPAGGAAGELVDGAAGWRAFHRELQRARRMECPLALLRFPASDPAAAAAVAGLVRETDLAWRDEGDVFVALPAAERATAISFVERAARMVDGLADLPVWIAVFPVDGLTPQALRRAATPMPEPLWRHVAAAATRGLAASARARPPATAPTPPTLQPLATGAEVGAVGPPPVVERERHGHGTRGRTS
jgi:hypothetical protein